MSQRFRNARSGFFKFMVATMLMATFSVGAHTPLASSVPTNNANLTAAPANIVLKFPHAVQLTAVAVESADGKQKHTVAPLPDGKVKEATLSAPKLGAGAYVITWRAAGDDGHVMSGKIKFSIAAQ